MGSVGLDLGLDLEIVDLDLDEDLVGCCTCERATIILPRDCHFISCRLLRFVFSMTPVSELSTIVTEQRQNYITFDRLSQTTVRYWRE